MFLINKLIKQFRKAHLFRENWPVFLVFLLFSLLFAIYMVMVEGLSPLEAYYFLVTTSTTVGYGDYSPKTPLGQLLVTFYMIVGIALLGIFLAKITELMVNISSRRRKGLLKMKGKVDLIIAGYPNNEKVQSIVLELRNDARFDLAKIVCVNNQLAEKPAWMQRLAVDFVKGVASSSAILEMAGIMRAETVLILANDPSNMESDDYTTSACAVIERLNPQVRTIIEKVRKDDLLFQVVNADTIVEVASPSILAQEILDPGAIELQNAIFSTHTLGTQFNTLYQGNGCSWQELASHILTKNAIPEGFRNPGEKTFNLLPHQKDQVMPGALIKYRGRYLLDEF